jgi:transcriptional regulator with XRE-family HTH domain
MPKEREERPMADSLINVKELGEYVRRRREEKKVSLRSVANDTGVSASTLSRIENGIGTPDAATLSRLAVWLGMPLERLMSGALISVPDETPEKVVYYPTEAMPTIVEAHLRADRNLKPEAAKALAELFRVAYNQFATQSKE